MSIYTVWVINKAGGLVFFKEYQPYHAKISSNDALVIASTLQSVHAISTRIHPNHPSGFKRITLKPKHGAGYSVHIFQTPTGLKFMATSAPNEQVEPFLKRVYELYVDYTLKNYFHTSEMPIRCDQFEHHLGKLVGTTNNNIKK